jgi:uncharacterized protein
MVTLILTYIAMGAAAGILAGLLGVGGGLVLVPMLAFGFTAQGVPYDIIMHLALGTSMAGIMFTALSSFLAHNRLGVVDWDIVRRIVPGILVGTFLGACVAARLSTACLSVLFVVFVYYVAVQMIVDRKPKPYRHLPGRSGMFFAGSVIGGVSSFVGIGGGALSVPFMVWCNIAMHRAIGTSAAIGFPIAAAGTAGFVYSGLHASNLPDFSLGYVYLPALAGLVGASMLTAPLGAWLAYRLPVKQLKLVFAAFLVIMGTRALIALI